jgi:lipoprotein NlpD
MWRTLCLTAMLVLSGCANRPPVPVVDGNPQVMVEGGRGGTGVSASATAREGYYVVKKGDNLYRIGKAHGVTTADLVAWNNLTDDTKIEVGQELRVTLPEGAVEIKPIEAPAPIVLVSDSAQSAGNNTDALKREPKGGKVAYSETALAQVRAMDGGPPPAKPIEQPTPAPAPMPPPSTPVAPAPAPVATDGIDWTWPVAGKMISGFVEGATGKESNKGIDLAGRVGEPIRAAASGTVTYVGSLRGYGDFLVVRHSGRFISVYAHASKIVVKKDQAVTKGQKIAEVGSSDSDRPKLHFEIRQDSNPIDPLTLLPARQ